MTGLHEDFMKLITYEYSNHSLHCSFDIPLLPEFTLIDLQQPLWLPDTHKPSMPLPLHLPPINIRNHKEHRQNKKNHHQQTKPPTAQPRTRYHPQTIPTPKLEKLRLPRLPMKSARTKPPSPLIPPRHHMLHQIRHQLERQHRELNIHPINPQTPILTSQNQRTNPR